MKLLIDTHIWLWSRAEPARLKRRVARALESTSNELWLSPLSVWELTVLVEKGRVSIGSSVEEWARLALERVSVREAPLTKEVVFCSREIYLPHRDPVDTLLAATARFYDLTLVTADELMLGGKGFRVLANR